MTITNISAIITAEDQALLDQSREDFAEVLTIVETFMVTDEASMERATDLISSVKKGLKALEARRKEITSPMNDEIKSVNNIFNGLKEQGNKATDVLARQMTDHLHQKEHEERKAELERRRLEEAERKKGQADLEELAALGDEDAKRQMGANTIREKEMTRPEPPIHRTVSRGNVGRSSLVKGKITIRVVNINQVPARYLEINETAVRAAYQSGVRNIAGLEVKQEQTLRVS